MIIPRLDFKALTIIAFQPSRLSTIKSWKTVFLAKYKIAITRPRGAAAGVKNLENEPLFRAF